MTCDAPCGSERDRTIACRVCGCPDHTALFAKDGFRVVRCRACGLQYTAVSPTEQDLKALYGESYFRSGGKGVSYYDYLAEEATMERNARARLAVIERLRPTSPGACLLDVGCATGAFLGVARSRWHVAGVELSEFAASRARQRYGLSVFTGTVADASYPSGHFDVVTMWDTVEHLADPRVDLAEIRRVMKDDGMLVLTTGDVRSLAARICGRHWHLYNPRQHLSFFSTETLRSLLDRAGFRMVRTSHPGNSYTLGYLASSLAMYYPCALTRILHRLLSGAALKDLPVYVNLADIMTVYAVKAPGGSPVMSQKL